MGTDWMWAVGIVLVAYGWITAMVDRKESKMEVNEIVIDEVFECYSVYYCDMFDALNVVPTKGYDRDDIGRYAKCYLFFDNRKFGRPRFVGTERTPDGLRPDGLVTSKGFLALTGKFLNDLKDIPLDKGHVPALWYRQRPGLELGRPHRVNITCDWTMRNIEIIDGVMSSIDDTLPSLDDSDD